jgi:nitroimidazol reductase NimA-like FMN-containing flavoprotein (pyridoxamine 5'-phosphate oxidase superfamily)
MSGGATEAHVRAATVAPMPDALPEWEPGTVAVLSTGAGPPHAIPVSTAVRAGPRRILFALASRRESLARLRRDPRAAMTILAAGDVAVTAHGRARVVEDPMTAGEVAALALEVDVVQDHRQPRFEIQAGVRWRWTDPEAERRDAEVRAELARLAAGRPG